MHTTTNARADEGLAPAARRSRVLVSVGLSGLVTLLCALLLPFVPLAVPESTVSWPRDPVRPESTLLTLTAYRPLAMELRFSCAVAHVARGGGGLIVSTMQPELPAGASSGLLVEVAAERLRVRALGRVVLDEPLPAGPCEYRISGRSAGLPTFLAQPPSPAGRIDPAVPVGRELPPPGRFATADNSTLVIARDGRDLVRLPARQLPDVDMLATSLPQLPANMAGGLAVELRVDDEFSSSPTALKMVLLIVMASMLVTTAVLLMVMDRPRSWRFGAHRPRWIDLLVPVALVGWTFIAPATDDDGWFGTQARNATTSGDVGSYFQLYDQSFTPFTWIYHGLAGWQQLVGTAPVLQRIPALACGLLCWLLLRRFTAVAVAAAETAPARGRLARPVAAVLAVVFLAWWLPYNMGVRPESVVALCAAATMLAVLAAGGGARLTFAWLACASAGVGLAAHTTGVIVLAPLLAGCGLLWSVVRVPSEPLATALRAVAVGSGAATASLLGFADGGLRDVLRAQTLLASVLPQDGWADEVERYVFLLDPIPMGSYARRAAVLACLLGLGWFGVLALVAAARRVSLPTPLAVAGASTALAFAALSLTPSKWTHHFGALAGIGAAFLALLLVFAVPVTCRLLAGTRPLTSVLVLAAGSVVLATALSWRGPNSWPYAWLEGVHRAYLPPELAGFSLGSPLLWSAVLVVVGLLVVARRRSVGTDWRWSALAAVPIVVVLSLLGSTGYLLGSFGSAAARGVPPESLWAQAVADPGGSRCGAAGAVRVLDPFTAQPLPAAGLPGPPPVDGFVTGGGYYPGDAPQGSAAGVVWGSLAGRAGGTPDHNTGTMSTGWYALPATLENGAAVTVLAAGSLGGGNSLTANYARDVSGTPVPLGAQPLVDSARATAWRTLTLTPPAGADLIRLDAVDGEGAVHGWLAFTAPAVARPIVLHDLLGSTAPVALGWQLAFAYPCQRPSAAVRGVTEPPAFAVLRAEKPLDGLSDLAWQPGRGGLFGQVRRSQSVLQLATVGPVDPYLQVYAFDTRMSRDGYRLTTRSRTVAGADTSTG